MARKMLSGDGWSFEPARRPVPAEPQSLPDSGQKAKLTLEKRPNGREATRVSGFVLSAADRKALAAKLRKACGAGGTDAGDGMEVQGDHRAKVRDILSALGWNVKV